jgi:NADH oxidase (H2O2-forming)
MKIIIIGGGSAGTACALELRKKNKKHEITIIEKSKNFAYSPCAMPYVISGKIKNLKNIFLLNKKDYEENNIKIILNTEITKIDRKKKKITAKTDKEEKEFKYDKLVIATGSKTFIPEIKGLKKTKFYTLKTIEDTEKIIKTTKKNQKTAIIGSGMIGIELANALAEKKEKISIIENQEQILPKVFDEDIAEQIKKELEKKKIKIYEKAKIKEIKNKTIILEKEKIKFDKLFICTGARANTEIAKETGLKTEFGVKTNEYLQTSDKNIYSCGDCAESIEFNSGKKILSQLGTTAVRQAKVIAHNILGKKEKFNPVMNNIITKIGNLYAGAVGMNEKRTKELRIKTINSRYTGKTKSEYYPSESKITIKITCSKKGTIIGSQITGNEDISGRINLMALAIEKLINIKELAKLETCYNPAAAPIIDPITIVSEICIKKMNIQRK